MTEEKKIVTAICQECNKQFEYELNPKYPRKYCFDCSEIKKANFKAKEQPEDMEVPVVRPGEAPKVEQSKPVKEFHLSPEQVNTNALDLAIRWKETDDIEYILELATKFKEFIENGN